MIFFFSIVSTIVLVKFALSSLSSSKINSFLLIIASPNRYLCFHSLFLSGRCHYQALLLYVLIATEGHRLKKEEMSVKKKPHLNDSRAEMKQSSDVYLAGSITISQIKNFI